jgi:hypothetical protein
MQPDHTHCQGRILDALVAEKVMGLAGSVDMEWHLRDMKKLLPNSDLEVEIERLARRVELIPYYSTDMSAAWSVLETSDLMIIARTEYTLAVPNALDTQYDNEAEMGVKSANAAFAICLAALKLKDGNRIKKSETRP